MKTIILIALCECCNITGNRKQARTKSRRENPSMINL